MDNDPRRGYHPRPMNEGSPPSPPAAPPASSAPPPGRAPFAGSWRKRLAFYVLVGVGLVVLVQLLERRPREVDVYFVLTQLEIATETGRLDRSRLVELIAEIREGDELRATTTWSFRSGAPLEVGPARVRLRPGEYDVHFRLAFVGKDGARRLFALRRRLAVTDSDQPILLDVRG